MRRLCISGCNLDTNATKRLYKSFIFPQFYKKLFSVVLGKSAELSEKDFGKIRYVVESDCIHYF